VGHLIAILPKFRLEFNSHLHGFSRTHKFEQSRPDGLGLGMSSQSALKEGAGKDNSKRSCRSFKLFPPQSRCLASVRLGSETDVESKPSLNTVKKIAQLDSAQDLAVIGTLGIQ
jgi:hypothetical protein